MPIRVNIFQDGEDSALGFAPNPRGMKRAHELDADDDGDTPRKGWKRLTTKEEVTLFEICNRHADSFGRRSDLCNWWKTVADEFSHANGRPYSWHSVRRKVEMVTKKRIKFLEDQQQRQRDLSGTIPVPDVMNPQWCAVLDLWIPTWQHWEESEAQRIAKRDATYRKRSQSKLDSLWKPPPQTAAPALEPVDLTSPASPDDTGMDDANDSYEGPIVLVTRSPQPTAVPATAAPSVDRLSSIPPSIPLSNGGVRLPPGFDTMFANNHSQSNRWPATFPPAPKAAAEPSSDNPVFNAMLEAIGKLNKHLDNASDNNKNKVGPDARASPVISALVQSATESTPQHQASPEVSRRAASSISSRDYERMKEELRQELKDEFRREMRAELRRERAAFEEKLDSVQRTQDMILEMLRQEPA
ncbi:hypothetical protein PMG11_00917 [Penicillium brasilianum]|uniref:Uncharacterized protein n=1 Tax=Penicillium brasilianum TaxID=104259 RepID=A0A0F7TCY3_PENBI|nr:hypothetical protein PMG11_00917 [Penicillium brasilianum]